MMEKAEIRHRRQTSWPRSAKSIPIKARRCRRSIAYETDYSHDYLATLFAVAIVPFTRTDIPCSLATLNGGYGLALLGSVQPNNARWCPEMT